MNGKQFSSDSITSSSVNMCKNMVDIYRLYWTLDKSMASLSTRHAIWAFALDGNLAKSC